MWHLDVALVLGRQMFSMEQVEANAQLEALEQDSEERHCGGRSEVILLEAENKD